MKYIHLIISLILTISIIFPATLSPKVFIPLKAKIVIYWRYIPERVNPLDIRKAFKYSASITATKSPAGDGSIKGKQIVSLIKRKTPYKTFVRCRALSVKEGEDPSNRPTLASIAVRDDNTTYDNYVTTTPEGDRAIYVDVIVSR